MDTRILHHIDQGGDVLRPGQGLISLYIEVNVSSNRIGYFVYALSTAAVRSRSHLRLPTVAAADLEDFVRIRRNDYVVEQRGETNDLVNSAHQGLAGDLAQHFARQTSGSEPGGDDGDGSHAVLVSFF